MASVGELIDRIAVMDDEVDRINAQLSTLKKKRSVVEGRLMKVLSKQKLNKASGTLAHASVGSRRHAGIKDMAKFNKYVKAKNAFDLYQRRINSKAYFDRLAAGDSVPGVTVFEHQFVKITRKRD
jgi:hypothetical protein